MCIIAYNRRQADPIPAYLFLRFKQENKDGIGLMWAERGRLRSAKYLNEPRKAWKHYLRLRNRKRVDVALHFRLATSGPVAVDTCHPFFINENLALMHNGVVKIDHNKEHEVDTVAFINHIIRKLPNNWLHDKYLIQMLEKYNDTSKFLLMDNNGQVTILNEQRGHWSDKNWYSKYINTSSNIYIRRQSSYTGRTYSRKSSKTKNNWYSYPSVYGGSARKETTKESDDVFTKSRGYDRGYIVGEKEFEFYLCLECLTDKLKDIAREMPGKDFGAECEICKIKLY